MKYIGAFVIVLVLIFIGVFTLSRQDGNSPLIASPLPVDSTVVDKLMAGGSSYADPKGVFTFLYPNDYKMDTQNNGQYIRFIKIGETQKGQTEIYDGVLIHFEVATLDDQSLSEFVDSRIIQVPADGSSEVVEQKQSVKIGNYSGYKYKVRSLGTSDYIVLAKDENASNAVIITTLIADPQSKNYQGEVEASLLTIQLLK